MARARMWIAAFKAGPVRVLHGLDKVEEGRSGYEIRWLVARYGVQGVCGWDWTYLHNQSSTRKDA